MKIPTRFHVVLIALAALASGTVLAAGPDMQARGPDMDKLALLLDLDEHQKGEVQKVLEAQREQIRAAREQARATGERPTREEMRAKHEELRQDTRTKLGAILNEQQMKKFDALAEYRRGRHSGRHPAHDKAD